ncbi:MAG: SAM-dependent methyltransferase, partial [Actinomycetota bacterium]
AGPGTLARTVTVAAGACLDAGALEWVMVERADAQRRHHPTGPHLWSVSSDADLDRVDVVFANELLDNLGFDIVERTERGWVECRVATDGAAFVLVAGEAAETPHSADAARVGDRLPTVPAAVEWVGERRRRFPDARVVVFDYAAPVTDLLERDGAWLRSYRDHVRVHDWLMQPGSCDITIDLPVEPLAAIAGASIETQADFLRRHGIDALVEEGRRLWSASAHIGDLAALRARSRVTEADALLDPTGMGAFAVFSWPGRDSPRAPAR